ncbi:type II toxin-antitoxin system VapC family toxin [Candidatus Peregrinibacteria bacterium]|nr:type II toxin-antitoxin system VapC family toxin [Candidatus Peregrinibacteria bacterium]
MKFKQDYVNEEIEIAMPTSCLYETMNTIARKIPAAATLILSQILTMEIEEIGLALENSSSAVEIIEKCPKLSFYDAIYHAIAIRNQATFITADEKYYNQAKSLKHIKLLKDYK